MNIYNSFTEKELLKDLIISEKVLANSYNDAISDSSNQLLREIFLKCLIDTQKSEYTIVDALEQRGWNKTAVSKNVEPMDVIERFNSINW